MSAVVWGALALVCGAANPEVLVKADNALADFRPEGAVVILEEARKQGPWKHADHVRLYELLGIAYAYLERPKEATAAFEKVLSLEPGHAISYTLSPKVTFVFEQARKGAAQQAPPAVDLSWPRDLQVGSEVPLTVEVLSDPAAQFARARLYFRLEGEAEYRGRSVDLPKTTDTPRRASLELEPLAPGAKQAKAAEVYLIVEDAVGNEVLPYASPERPRQVSLAYETPAPWYGKWWVWVIAGSAVAATAGVAAYAVSQGGPPETVGGNFTVQR